MTRRLLVFVGLLCGAAGSAAAQPPADEAPAIRRWVDVQHLQIASRFRWIEASDGRITSSTIQWQPQVRARVRLDRAGRVSVHLGAFGGSHFVSGWNNTGAGLGAFGGDFALRQIFVAVAARPDLELQGGGLYLLRGENTEITSYDNDAFVVGERLVYRRPRGTLSQLAVTVGHIGDYRTPNVFRRLARLDTWNYGQLLVAARAGARTSLSADYTYEDGRDLLREGLVVRAPAPLTAVRLEAYQRVSAPRGAGYSAGADVRLTSRFTVTAGLAHVDRDYWVPGYTSPNADRFERGTRFFSAGSYALSRDVSIGWYQGHAFSTPYSIPNARRWEVVLTVNPTATLRARGVF